MQKNQTIQMLSIILIVFLLLAVLVYWALRVPDELKHIPSVPLFKSIFANFKKMTFDERRKYLYTDKLEKYGVLRQFMNTKWMIVLGSPETAERLYMEPDNFPKLLLNTIFKGTLFSKFLGENLVHSNGDHWKKYRRVVNKAFKKQFEPKIFIDVVDELTQVIDSHNGKNVDMSNYLRRLTMEVLGLSLMDVKMDAILSKDALFNHHYHNMIKNLFTPLTLMFKFLDHPKNPMRTSAYQSLKYLEDYFEVVLKERRERLKTSTKEPSDILSLLLKETEVNNEFTDKELRDNIMIFVLAGHDTTAFSLAVAIYFLCKYPDIQEKARQEALTVFGKPGSDKKVPITHDQLKEIPFIDAIINESMRMYPAVARLPTRINVKKFEVNGITIPKNQLLFLETIHFQRSDKYWNKPDTFDPYRFYGHTKKDLVHPFAWSPFGGGQRQCIGINFSMMEQRITLALLLLNYNFKLSKFVEPNAPLEQSVLFLLSSSGVNVDFEPINY